MNTRLRFANKGTGEYTNEFNVMKFKFTMGKQYSKSTGFIDMKTFYSEFSVEIAGDESMRMFLYECYINHELVSGEIVVDNSQNSIYDNEPDTRLFKFENATFFRLNENYDLDSHDKYCFAIGFVCEQVTVDDTGFSFLTSTVRF
ncbi:hypothetical protein [Parabacteroides sp.]